MSDNIILRAARLAREAHEGQTRKWSETPAIAHPARVAGRVAVHPKATEVMVAAGFLHDGPEDSNLPFETIERLISPEVSFIVSWLTNSSKGSSAPRAERKAADRKKLKDAPWEAKLIKLIDRIDNLRDMEGAPASFKVLYAEESVLLAYAIGDADLFLQRELLAAANALIPKSE